MTRLVILGAAHIHLHDAVAVLGQREDVGVVGITDPDIARARRWALQFDAPVVPWGDPPSCDAALVAGSTSEHESALRSLWRRHRIPTFVEKPLGPDLRSTLATLDAAPPLLQVGHFLRYWPAMRELQRRVLAGEVGTVRHVDARFTHDGLARGWFDGEHSWMRATADGGGGFHDLATHCVDVAVALGQRDLAVERLERSADHQAAARLTAPGGVTVDIEAGWEGDDMEVAVEVHGDEGRLTATGSDLRRGVQVLGRWRPPAAQDAIEVWLDHVTGRPAPPLVPRDDIVDVARVQDRLRRADERGA